MFKKSKETFYIRKLTIGVVSVAVAGLLVINNAQVNADETTTDTVEQVATDTELTESDLIQAQADQDQTITEAQAAGVEVTTEDTVTTSDLSEAVTNTVADTEAIQDATAQQEQNNADYAVAIENYNQEVADNQAAYEAAVADYEAKTTKGGYLSEAAGQSLIFESGSEPNTIAEVDNNAIAVDQATALAWVEANGVEEKDIIANDIISNPNYISSGSYYFLQQGIPTVVTYNNLENTYFNTTKVASVVYTYTLESPESGDQVLVKFFNDPTNTIDVISLNQTTQIGMDVQFLDENGEAIDVSGALLSFASLNSGAVYDDESESYILNSDEYVTNFDGDYIAINGSSVSYNASENRAYAATSNESLEQGSRFEQYEWDGTELSWYGAIIGVVGDDGEIHFSFGSNNRSTQWFTFNSNVKAYSVPVLETVEEPTLQVVSVRYTPYQYQAPTSSLDDTIVSEESLDDPETTVLNPTTDDISADVDDEINTDDEVTAGDTAVIVPRQEAIDNALDPVSSVTVSDAYIADTLPKTGTEKQSLFAILLGTLLTLSGLIGIRKKTDK
ncbi:LPXTG-motif cell wall anchor domain-containing protein/signal peptide-containing protein, YSIRK family [Streptococcus gallolyticus]|uniref:LPXTG-motif cell wall anchor domain-containing protein/signal peptide-containing protein, YSIRK family n=1 Tax=Streptococcus gallolyticus TaxID=315405 RepID=A0A1H7UA41_9STRE|nr:GbpC/Spa domain-containing protein [Streptococcus gallolyticus]SEF19527.1 LPXTG-motif cell wall anchor domain-containing protein/signal peptide-containing protein, YSIRK family [Streptococcus gallolyticus]SEL93821.1 LPXTG-motif cell wall anchor domain-containing protein/signal peptide-containing protein, YSIRK family [Streptococcus gallolyticus]